MDDYARPDALVSTDWVAEHLNDPGVRLVESDEDYLLYDTGHIQGAVRLDWFTTLQHPERRDFLTYQDFEEVCSQRGIGNDTTVVFYGDKDNWFACYALWLFQYFGHDPDRLKIMNGGRKKWLIENRPVTREVPTYPPTDYRASEPDQSVRAYRDQVFEHWRNRRPMVDVRSPQEYTGELIHMPNYPQEGAQRGGHIPGAFNIPWSKAVDPDDGTFLPPGELKKLYTENARLGRDDEIIAYCRIGERSAHTWFVLTYLLGYPRVRNYDGSWTEWGNLVNAPIEKGTA